MSKRTRTTTPVTTLVTTPTTEVVTPVTTPEVPPTLTTLELQLQAEITRLQGILAEREVHILYTSTMVKPVQLVRDQFVKWVQSGKPLSRKGVVDLCVSMGVARNTAGTQYQYMFKRYNSGELVIPPVEG